MIKAFTLIEMLVTIVIIAVMLGILLPVLLQAQNNAHKATCESNLQSIGQSIRLYVDDNDGNWIPISAWTQWNSLSKTPLAGCPLTPQTKLTEFDNSHVVGYAYNGLLGVLNSRLEEKGIMHLFPANDKDIIHPSNTVAALDSSNAIAQAPDPNKYVSPYPYGSEHSWERHNGGANYLFCDNHVKWLRADEVLPGIPAINDGTKPAFAVRTETKP